MMNIVPIEELLQTFKELQTVRIQKTNHNSLLVKKTAVRQSSTRLSLSLRLKCKSKNRSTNKTLLV